MGLPESQTYDFSAVEYDIKYKKCPHLCTVYFLNTRGPQQAAFDYDYFQINDAESEFQRDLTVIFS